MWLQGERDAAKALAEETLRNTQGEVQPLPQVTALGSVTLLAAYDGDVGGVRPRIDELIEICARAGYPWYEIAGKVSRGWAVAHEDPEVGLKEMQDALATLEASGSDFVTALDIPLLAGRQLAVGRAEEALGSADRGITMAEETGFRAYLAELYRIRGEALQAMDPTDEEAIENALHKALEVAREQGAGAFESRIQQTLRNRSPESSRVRSRP
jgi:predicted ATPase